MARERPLAVAGGGDGPAGLGAGDDGDGGGDPDAEAELGPFVRTGPDQGAGSAAVHRKAEEGVTAEPWQPTTTRLGVPLPERRDDMHEAFLGLAVCHCRPASTEPSHLS
ncbi:hypothetical protein GCM10010524_25710 [Streptomyces mexicanus]